MNMKSTNIYEETSIPRLDCVNARIRDLNIGVVSSNIVPKTSIQDIGSEAKPFNNGYFNNISIDTGVFDNVKTDSIEPNKTTSITFNDSVLNDVGSIQSDVSLYINTPLITFNNTTLGSSGQKLVDVYLKNLFIEILMSSLIPYTSQLDLGDINHYFKYGYIQHVKCDDITSSTETPISINNISITGNASINNIINTVITSGTANLAIANITTANINNLVVGSQTFQSMTVNGLMKCGILEVDNYLNSNLSLNVDNMYGIGSINKRIKYIYSVNNLFDNLEVTNDLILPDESIVNDYIKNGSITYNKFLLNNGDILPIKIGNGILYSQLSLSNGDISAAKIANGILYSQLSLSNGDITANKIANGVVYSQLSLSNGDIPVSKLDSNSGTGTKYLQDTTPPSWAVVQSTFDPLNINSNLIPTATTYNIGSPSLNFNNVYFSNVYLYSLIPWVSNIGISGNLVPSINESKNLGDNTTPKRFLNIYTKNTYTDSLYNASSATYITLGSNLGPDTNDTMEIGTSGKILHYLRTYYSTISQLYTPFISGTGTNNTVRVDCSICPTTDQVKNLGNITTTNNRFLNGWIKNIICDTIGVMTASDITANNNILPLNSGSVQSLGSSSYRWNVYSNVLNCPVAWIDSISELTSGNGIIIKNNILSYSSTNKNIGDNSTGKFGSIYSVASRCDALYAGSLYQSMGIFTDDSFSIGDSTHRLSNCYINNCNVTTLTSTNTNIIIDKPIQSKSIFSTSNNTEYIGEAVKKYHTIFVSNIGEALYPTSNIFTSNMFALNFNSNGSTLTKYLRDDLTWQTIASGGMADLTTINADIAYLKYKKTDSTPVISIESTNGIAQLLTYRTYNTDLWNSQYTVLKQDENNSHVLMSNIPILTQNTYGKRCASMIRTVYDQNNNGNLPNIEINVRSSWSNYNAPCFELRQRCLTNSTNMIIMSSEAYPNYSAQHQALIVNNIIDTSNPFATYNYSFLILYAHGSNSVNTASYGYSTISNRNVKEDIKIIDYNSRVKILTESITKDRIGLRVYKYKYKMDKNNLCVKDHSISIMADEYESNKNLMFCSNEDENDEYTHFNKNCIDLGAQIGYLLNCCKDLYINKYRRNTVKYKDSQYKKLISDNENLNNRCALLESENQKLHDRITKLEYEQKKVNIILEKLMMKISSFTPDTDEEIIE